MADRREAPRGRRGAGRPRAAQALIVPALLLIVLAACSAASTPLPGGSSAPLASSASAPSLAQPTAGASETSLLTAPAGVPTAAPDHKYFFVKHTSDPEMQQATGLPSAKFFQQELWTDTPGLPEGETYCQFFANQGGISIALTVATGPAFTQFEAAIEAAGSAGREELPGIGEHASYAPAIHTGGARTHGVLVLLKITDLSGSGLAGLDLKTAFIGVLTIVVGRV